MDKNKDILIAIVIIVIAGMITYAQTVNEATKSNEANVKREIIINCNYIKTPTVECVEKLSKYLDIKEK